MPCHMGVQCESLHESKQIPAAGPRTSMWQPRAAHICWQDFENPGGVLCLAWVGPSCAAGKLLQAGVTHHSLAMDHPASTCPVPRGPTINNDAADSSDWRGQPQRKAAGQGCQRPLPCCWPCPGNEVCADSCSTSNASPGSNRSCTCSLKGCIQEDGRDRRSDQGWPGSGSPTACCSHWRWAIRRLRCWWVGLGLKSPSTRFSISLQLWLLHLAQSNGGSISGRNVCDSLRDFVAGPCLFTETLAKGGVETYLIERKLDNCKVRPVWRHAWSSTI
jgi:hypothetical protein